MKTVLLIALFAIIDCAFAQSQDTARPLNSGDITIYNEYTPSIRTANRLQYMPVIIDTVKVQPRFSYSINSVQYPTLFAPAPLQSAELKGEPLKPIDNGWVKIGFGNYITPYIEANYHNLRSKDYSIGAYARHHSSHGKITNTHDERVYAGFMDNDLKLYGKKFLANSTVFSNISFATRDDYFYGVNPDFFSSDLFIPKVKADIEKQQYLLLGIDAGIHSNLMGPQDLNYAFKIDYHYLTAIDTTHQNYLGLNLNLNKNIKKLNIGADIDFDLYRTNIIDSALLVPAINPYVTYTNKQWQIKAGVTGIAEFCGDSSKYHLYPDILIQHNISNTLIPYFSFKGKLQANDFEQIAFENPYTTYRLMVQPTNYSQIIDLGIKGNIDRKIRFNLSGNYSKIDNMHFFVIDTTTTLKNKFTAVYSNVERFSGYGEIMVVPNDRLNIYLNGHYYWYSYIRSEEKPWHMPNFDISLCAKYNLTKELSIGGCVYVVGTRWSKDYSLSNPVYKMKPYFDINLQAEYKFASNFSSFIYLNNIAAQKYYIWEHYRAYGFNALAGIKYSF
ncbi:MAG TPA: hypothetical protein PLP11_00950 [Bacteroidales bacterium]|nr:hypothetical protein [Bacteroidales bacterium]